ncbi:hypothetical protein P171DRAFT_442871 [Karstenula rhodostoma CBS 690.94]|uniref:Uncharacterized protein n=1 Tax=Karstenula rhodostoma CBS 690.94 TaxID=1392251 RepID=A0A9P4PK19_9PLEO|nr:hypothetical protein P171DRAFT_442871 [Karstenula rhodostoma CBS 690.94]
MGQFTSSSPDQTSTTLRPNTPPTQPNTATMPPPEPTASPRPFPFLRLPKTIRRQVYECLPVRTKYVPGYRGDTNNKIYKDKPVVILVLCYVERTIVQTCRQLAAEAEPVLEITTMKLGPARLLVAAEYFHRIPLTSSSHIRHDIGFLRRMQDDATWPRLRIADQDRMNKALEDQQILMWARILQLNLLSEKCISIGIFIGKQAQEVGSQECLSNISKQLDQIMGLQWWNNDCRRTRLMLKVSVEWEGSNVKDDTRRYLLSGNVVESCAFDGDDSKEEYDTTLLLEYPDFQYQNPVEKRNTMTLACKGEDAFERQGGVIREISTGRVVAWVPHDPSTRSQQQSASRNPASRSQRGGSQQQASRSGGRSSQLLQPGGSRQQQQQSSRSAGRGSQSRQPGRAPPAQAPGIPSTSSSSVGSGSGQGRRRGPNYRHSGGRGRGAHRGRSGGPGS